eukprot:g1143.t1
MGGPCLNSDGDVTAMLLVTRAKTTKAFTDVDENALELFCHSVALLLTSMNLQDKQKRINSEVQNVEDLQTRCISQQSWMELSKDFYDNVSKIWYISELHDFVNQQYRRMIQARKVELFVMTDSAIIEDQMNRIAIGRNQKEFLVDCFSADPIARSVSLKLQSWKERAPASPSRRKAMQDDFPSVLELENKEGIVWGSLIPLANKKTQTLLGFLLIHGGMEAKTGTYDNPYYVYFPNFCRDLIARIKTRDSRNEQATMEINLSEKVQAEKVSKLKNEIESLITDRESLEKLLNNERDQHDLNMSKLREAHDSKISLMQSEIETLQTLRENNQKTKEKSLMRMSAQLTSEMATLKTKLDESVHQLHTSVTPKGQEFQNTLTFDVEPREGIQQETQTTELLSPMHSPTRMKLHRTNGENLTIDGSTNTGGNVLPSPIVSDTQTINQQHSMFTDSTIVGTRHMTAAGFDLTIKSSNPSPNFSVNLVGTPNSTDSNMKTKTKVSSLSDHEKKKKKSKGKMKLRTKRKSSKNFQRSTSSSRSRNHTSFREYSVPRNRLLHRNHDLINSEYTLLGQRYLTSPPSGPKRKRKGRKKRG